MGPAFVIIFWLIAGGIFALICGSLLALFLYGRYWKKRWLQWFAGIPLALLCICALIFVTGISVGIYRSTKPAYVKNIQSQVWSFADTSSIYLRFECSEAEFEQLRSPEFSQIAPNIAKQSIDTVFDGAPDWWRPNTEIGSQCYEFNREGEGSTNGLYLERKILLYDPRTETAHYAFSGSL